MVIPNMDEILEQDSEQSSSAEDEGTLAGPIAQVRSLQDIKNDRDSKITRSDPALDGFRAVKTGDDGNCERIRNINDAKEMIKQLSVGDKKLNSAKSQLKLSSTAYGVRMLSRDIFNTKVELQVENLLIVTKNEDRSLVYLVRELVEWLLIHSPHVTVYVEKYMKGSKKFGAEDIYKDSRCTEHRIKYWDDDFIAKHDGFFDLIMTLGGDGTVLFVSSIFQRHVPPVLSFSLGSLGFLTNYQYEHFREDLPKILNNKIKTNLRMRLECKVYRRHPPVLDPRTGEKIAVAELISQRQVLNELTVDRGPSPFISNLDLYGDDSLLTVAQADGIIIATPTGSTAYSLSAGGPLVYPSVNAVVVTPVCPHTLSFRPILLPDSMNLKVKVSMKSRATAWASFDGKERTELQKGDYITVQTSPYAFPTVESHRTEFIESISRSLNWNVRREQKSFTHMLSRKNREKYVTDKSGRDEWEEREDDEVLVVQAEDPAQASNMMHKASDRNSIGGKPSFTV
ncbi:YEF1 (YEL041W) and UTR1 (YJR049C) [Zygosaccharomyces parabailii]|nr:YEF1 (YEL041W) and UTR1 (YJR049C) [Zygosaccharomyces parabailii]CDH13993.1 related to ATP-NADH kinase YEF1 [Zygosaccharomyces bailii ISA1307]